MSLEITKSIFINGTMDIDYCIRTDGPNCISVYAKEIGDSGPFDYESPLLYLTKEEARAIARSLDELATGFSIR